MSDTSFSVFKLLYTGVDRPFSGSGILVSSILKIRIETEPSKIILFLGHGSPSKAKFYIPKLITLKPILSTLLKFTRTITNVQFPTATLTTVSFKVNTVSI